MWLWMQDKYFSSSAQVVIIMTPLVMPDFQKQDNNAKINTNSW